MRLTGGSFAALYYYHAIVAKWLYRSGVDSLELALQGEKKEKKKKKNVIALEI
jgi:hypothetical protein